MMEDNTIYRIDRINIFPDFDPTTLRNDSTRLGRLDTVSYRGLNVIYEKRLNLRPSVLRYTVPLYPNSVYNASQVSRTYSDLMALGYFKSAKSPSTSSPAGRHGQPDLLHRRDGRHDAVPLHARGIPHVQHPLYADAQAEFQGRSRGSTTSSFYGLTATVGYQNRNIFRGAESFDVSFTAGTSS